MDFHWFASVSVFIIKGSMTAVAKELQILLSRCQKSRNGGFYVMNHRVKTASIWKPRMIGLLCFTSLLSIVTALLDFMIPVAISIFLNWYKAGMLYSFWAFLGVLLP